ncbi:MAG: hypothetical protein COC01_10145 [Bacteroidetes bacterium]|nr:hypothetical protein [Bacteroidia bacterium]PCH65213.1 MAG: hypothetical protein COC01_10145 [Bacteroidota bacterium]
MIGRNSIFLLVFLLFSALVNAQETTIRGFAHFNAGVNLTDPPTSFINLEEQDLFITSEISDRISFLGESVLKEKGSIGLERVVIKYNLKGNHNLLFGRFHTPINYWNMTYHHGRVFFPTVYRPKMFYRGILPIHILGFRLQGANLGKQKFGYDFVFSEVLALNLNIKPADGMQLATSIYLKRAKYDATSPHFSNDTINTVDHGLVSASFSYFSSNVEFLAEASFAHNIADNDLKSSTLAYYAYTGYRFGHVVPYMRFDQIRYDVNELYYSTNNDVLTYVLGTRYEFNYLSSLKFEYGLEYTEADGYSNKLYLQFAVGF